MSPAGELSPEKDKKKLNQTIRVKLFLCVCKISSISRSFARVPNSQTSPFLFMAAASVLHKPLNCQDVASAPVCFDEMLMIFVWPSCHDQTKGLFFKLFYPDCMPFPAPRVTVKPNPVSLLLKQRCFQKTKRATKTDSCSISRAHSWFGHETSHFSLLSFIYSVEEEGTADQTQASGSVWQN